MKLNQFFRFFLLFLFLLQPVLSQQEFVLGEFRISKILDGDTFRLEGLDRSTRLLGIDTEETFKDSDAELKVNDISGYWAEYYAHKKDSSNKPAKIESPFGYDTWQWTKKLFKDVVKVRLEVDDYKRVMDMFNRYLVYVIAINEDGTEFNYNIECVKQGYSPYFSKYGYSARFHNEFLTAQKNAQDKKLRIWSGKELCYPDYPERIKWWDKRAEQIKHFENTYAGKQGYFSMLDKSDFNKLVNHVGDSVVIFGNISRVITDNNPRIAKLEINEYDTVDLVFFQQNFSLIDELDLDNPVDYYIYAKGKLTEYKGKKQIIIDDKSQIWNE